MKSESLVGIRTMREVGGSLDHARKAPRAKGQLSLHRPYEGKLEVSPATEWQIAQRLRLEEQRRRIQDTARARKRALFLKTRARLLAATERNKRLMQYRYEADRARWQSDSPDGGRGGGSRG
jgi:hypothetical protein